MKAFYGNLTSMGKDRALAEAQRAMQKSYPHPFYWAAFQLIGREE